MEKKFVAELHDIGKLMNHKDCKYMITHYFNKDELQKNNISFPDNSTFNGIQKHHCKESNPYCKKEEDIFNDLDIVLLIMADHFASGFSRLDKTLQDRIKELISVEDKSVYKLWNKSESKNIKDELVKCTKENIETILGIITENNWGKLQADYNRLLDIIPEDKMLLFNVISLKTHITLVGKVYRFLKSQVENFESGKIKFLGDNLLRSFTGVKDIENTIQFKLVFVSIKMPNFIARVNDLSFFEILEKQLNLLKKDDHVLFVSPESFLLICGKNKEVVEEKFIAKLVESGFRLETKEVIKPFSELIKLPQELVKNEIKKEYESMKKILQNEKIPKENKNNKKEDFIRIYAMFKHIYEPKRPKEIRILCDICQQNEAIPYNNLTEEEKKVVTKEENNKQIIESLCKYCLNIRKEYEEHDNLKSFARWEEELPRPDALWIKISLDIDNLTKALKMNYNKYIDTVLKNYPDLAQEVKDQYELKYTWVSEFLYEYDEFLEEFQEKLGEMLKTIKINRNYFVAKKIKTGQIKKLINVYIHLFQKYFPDFSEFKNNPPIRFSVVCANVKSPLIEIWRNIYKVRSPISIVLKNSNRLEIDIETMLYLDEKIDLSAKKISNFLHKLSEMYKQSGLNIIPLTKLFNERWKYENLYKAISERNLSILDILNWYKITKE